MAIKTATELAAKCKEVAQNFKTLYVMGCIGAPLNAANKERYCANHSYNTKPERTVKIKSATSGTFGFDCVCFLKSLLWGWDGDTSKTYGGAKYASNGVPDINADAMIRACSDVSTDFSKIEVGEVVWLTGHIGIYIGGGLAVECTPIWKDGVQITAVHNIGTKAGYNGRTWTKHGKLPYVSYGKKESGGKKEVKATDYARGFSSALAGDYKVTASALNVRHGAGTSKQIMVTIPKGTKVKCYGYYTTYTGTNWLCVQFTYNGVTYTGYASAKYLAK